MQGAGDLLLKLLLVWCHGALLLEISEVENVQERVILNDRLLSKGLSISTIDVEKLVFDGLLFVWVELKIGQ